MKLIEAVLAIFVLTVLCIALSDVVISLQEITEKTAKYISSGKVLEAVYKKTAQENKIHNKHEFFLWKEIFENDFELTNTTFSIISRSKKANLAEYRFCISDKEYRILMLVDGENYE